MQAPNKVYILPSQHNLQYDNGGEEYIRKDALLEWAKAKHMELDPPQNERDFGRIEAVEELIKHIESL